MMPSSNQLTNLSINKDLLKIENGYDGISLKF